MGINDTISRREKRAANDAPLKILRLDSTAPSHSSRVSSLNLLLYIFIFLHLVEPRRLGKRYSQTAFTMLRGTTQKDTLLLGIPIVQNLRVTRCRCHQTLCTATWIAGRRKTDSAPLPKWQLLSNATIIICSTVYQHNFFYVHAYNISNSLLKYPREPHSRATCIMTDQSSRDWYPKFGSAHRPS